MQGKRVASGLLTTTTTTSAQAAGRPHHDQASLRPRRERAKAYVWLSLSAAVIVASGCQPSAADIALATPSAAEQQLSSTVVASVGADGRGNHHSSAPKVTPDGRFVVFESLASDLVPNDTNGNQDIFVRDTIAETTLRVSVSTGGAQSNAHDTKPTISDDGRFVAYVSGATNLVSGDTNGKADCFVHDTQTGVTERVSLRSNGAQTDGSCTGAYISADGGEVILSAHAGLLETSTDFSRWEIVARDLATGAMHLPIEGLQGAAPDGSCDRQVPAGNFLAFHSSATNLVAGDTNNSSDVFLLDRTTSSITRVSLTDSGQQASQSLDFYAPDLSSDGRFVAFSTSGVLTPSDTNNKKDVYVRDVLLGTTTRVSVNDAGVQGNGHANWPSLSDAGGFVAFSTAADNFEGGRGCFLHDLDTGAVTRIDRRADGSLPTWPYCYSPVISADGSAIAFVASDDGLVAGLGSPYNDVFVTPGLPADACADCQTPWGTNAGGTEVTDIAWHYAMGYHFRPETDGEVVGLGGAFNGAKTVKLFERASGTLLAETSVTGDNSWAYAPVVAVPVSAGTEYTVAVYLDGTGGSYRYSFGSLPQTYGDVTVLGTTWASTSSNPDAIPTISYATYMYGQADIQFVPAAAEPVAVWQENQTGTTATGYSWNYALGYHFTPQVDGQVVGLGGQFDGTKTVKLFERASGTLLATAQVTADNTFAYTTITPVEVAAGTEYTVAAYLAGSGGSYQYNIAPFPQTDGDVAITGTTFASTSSNPDAVPTNNVTSVMYGQADILFAAD